MKLTKRHYYYLAFTTLAALYISASLLAPLGPNRFNLTATRTHALQLTILLPVVLIWIAAVFGAERFKNYTDSIKNHVDGGALSKVSTGLVILTISIIANGLFGVLRGWALKDGWLASFTIASNFLSAVLPLIGFAYMSAGSSQLNRLVKTRPGNRTILLMLVIASVAVAVVYITVLLRYKYASYTPDPNKYSSFYMSDPLILLTLALPYLAGWFLAFKAALNINLYRQQVKGVIYRAALARLVVGLFVVVAFYVIVQILIAFSTYLAGAGLGGLLILVYLLILIYGAGFLVIALGAKKLSNIEKVR